MDIYESDFVFVNEINDDYFTSKETATYFQMVLKRFFSEKKAVVGLAIVLVIMLLAVFGPIFARHTYSEIISVKVDGKEIAATCVKPTLGISEDDPEHYMFAGETFLFGTDDLGRDLFARTTRGARVSVLIAFVTILIDVIFGISFGLVSGYIGGKVDAVMQRFIEIVNSVPRLVIVSILAIFMPKGIGLVIVALAITEWIPMSKIARAQMLKIKNLEFVMASRTLGASDARIIFSDVLPNSLGQLVTQVLVSIPGAIFTESFLSFVGVGIMPPECSIGSLIEAGFQNLTILPYQIVPPTLTLALLMIGFNAIGEGIKKATTVGLGDI